MSLQHADALIELLSVLTNDDLVQLGLTGDQIACLHDIWEMSCEDYEKISGRPHPLSMPTDQDDAEMPVVHIQTHANPGSIN